MLCGGVNTVEIYKHTAHKVAAPGLIPARCNMTRALGPASSTDWAWTSSETAVAVGWSTIKGGTSPLAAHNAAVAAAGLARAV